MLIPIPTTYKGVQFRSRLEARWAVFFDELGIRWLYEPEGFELPSGRYLPDFFLPELCKPLWVEIKPESHQSGKDQRHREFARETDSFILLVGPPKVFLDVGDSGYETECDINYLPCVCNTCGKAGFQFDGRGDRVCGGSHAVSENRDKGYSHHFRAIKEAVETANAYRFW